MNEKCKYCDYVSKCSRKCEYNSILCRTQRSFPKVVDKSYEQLQQENKQLKAQIEEYQKALDETMSEKIDIQNNWNKLRDYALKKQAILFDTEYTCYSNVLDKMEELEAKK